LTIDHSGEKLVIGQPRAEVEVSGRFHRGQKVMAAGAAHEVPRRNGDQSPLRIEEEPVREPVDSDVVERLKSDPDLAEVAQIAEQLVNS
jgi:hypothetical protein